MTQGPSGFVAEPTDPCGAVELIARADLESARCAIAGVAVRTPTLACAGVTERAGTPVGFKAECLQGTGSFKLRGALAKVSALGDTADTGLVAASAGNHARAVAQAARIRGVGCEVFMPLDAPVSKVAAVERLGARVHLGGDSVEEAIELAREFGTNTERPLIHPFDDLDVIAGQSTVGLELLEDVPDLARVVLPVGGGGLASGVGIALHRAGRRDVEIVGVQARECAPYAVALHGGEPSLDAKGAGTTIADGIAVARPGALTLPLLRELMHRLYTVTEEEIADAVVFLAEHAKLVTEGAGAVAVAALLGNRLTPVSGTTVAVVSGGNVDGGLLAGLLHRHDATEGRRIRVFTHVPDRPGFLAELLNVVASSRANLLSLEHVREAMPRHVRETGVCLTLETRGRSHSEEVLGALLGAGYDARVDQ